jgi:hypothetical protein
MTTPPRPATLADVGSLLREEDIKRTYLAANAQREGMTPALLNVLAGKSLAETREIVEALPPSPAAADLAQHLREAATTAEEAHDIDKMRRAFGLTPEAVTAAKKATADGETGVLSLARLQQLKTAGREEAAARVARAK